MLFHAARAGKKCLYFTTLSEPAIKVIRYMQAFSFFDVELLERQIVFVDLGEAIRKGADAISAKVVSSVEQHEPALVAIDSFRSIGELVLVDIGLPKLDGYEVARRIRRELGAAAPLLLAMTGYGQPEDRRRAASAGFDAHMVKPLDAFELQRRLAGARRVRAADPRSGSDGATH